LTLSLKIRAECGNTACSDLCGGPEATPVPTAPRLPAAKITEIQLFTPAAWAKAKAKEKQITQAAYEDLPHH